MLSASFVYSGYSDYFRGYSEEGGDDYSEHLLYTYYGRDTSLRDIIDGLVEDSFTGPASESLSEDITQDDVRKALLGDMLNEQGRADYESGAIADCSVDWMAENDADDADDDDDDDDCESPIFIAVLLHDKSE